MWKAPSVLAACRPWENQAETEPEAPSLLVDFLSVRRY